MSDRGAPDRDQDTPLIEMDVDAPDDETSTAPSRTRTIALASLLVAGLAGAAVLGTFGWGVMREKDAKLAPPADVAGLRRDDSADAKATADDLRTVLSAEVDLDETTGAVFTDPADAQRSVLFFGGTALIWTPETDLDTVFGLFSDKTGDVTGIAEVPSGTFGGAMKCGTTTSAEGDIAVCGWADHGSLAVAMFPNRTAADSAKLMQQIRDTTQTRD